MRPGALAVREPPRREPRHTWDVVRIGRKISGCPAISAAFADGAIDRTKVRELLVVANADTERAWLERIRVPPRSRTIALASTDFRCGVPGCRHRAWLHIHHIRGRHIERPHDPANLVALCSGHHRVVHAGYLGVERLPDGALAFHRRHGVERTSHV